MFRGLTLVQSMNEPDEWAAIREKRSVAKTTLCGFSEIVSGLHASRLTGKVGFLLRRPFLKIAHLLYFEDPADEI